MTLDTTSLAQQIMAQMASLSGPRAPAQVTGVLAILPQTTAVAKVCQLAAANLGSPPGTGGADAEDYDKNLRAVQFWTQFTSDAPDPKDPDARDYWHDAFDELPYGHEPDLMEFGDDPTLFTDAQGTQAAIKVGEALRRVVNLASLGLDTTQTQDPKETGVFQVLQTEALLYHYCDRVGVFLNGSSF